MNNSKYQVFKSQLRLMGAGTCIENKKECRQGDISDREALEKKAIPIAVRTEEVQKRHTGLREKVKENFLNQ